MQSKSQARVSGRKNPTVYCVLVPRLLPTPPLCADGGPLPFAGYWLLATNYWLFFGIYIHRNENERNYRQTSAKKFAPNATCSLLTSFLCRTFRKIPTPPPPHFANSLVLYAKISRICALNRVNLRIYPEIFSIIRPPPRRQTASHPVKAES
jgi:hypothetical protein